MEVLQTTQFAHVSPLKRGLPLFLVKKLEKAIVDAHLNAKKNSKQVLEDKMLKAQRIREENQSMKAIKVMNHNNRVDQTQIKQVEKQINTNELQQQILSTKLEIAALQAKEHIQKQLLKAQQMGTARVNQAKNNRELLQAIIVSKTTYKEDRVNKKQVLNNSISEKHRNRNYEILKTVNKKRF